MNYQKKITMMKMSFFEEVLLVFYTSDVFNRFWPKKHIFRNRCSTKTTKNQPEKIPEKVANILKTRLFFLTYQIIFKPILSYQ